MFKHTKKHSVNTRQMVRDCIHLQPSIPSHTQELLYNKSSFAGIILLLSAVPRHVWTHAGQDSSPDLCRSGLVGRSHRPPPRFCGSSSACRWVCPPSRRSSSLTLLRNLPLSPVPNASSSPCGALWARRLGSCWRTIRPACWTAAVSSSSSLAGWFSFHLDGYRWI